MIAIYVICQTAKLKPPSNIPCIRYEAVKYCCIFHFLENLCSLTRCLINTFVKTRTEPHGPCINQSVVSVASDDRGDDESSQLIETEMEEARETPCKERKQRSFLFDKLYKKK